MNLKANAIDGGSGIKLGTSAEHCSMTRHRPRHIANWVRLPSQALRWEIMATGRC